MVRFSIVEDDAETAATVSGYIKKYAETFNLEIQIKSYGDAVSFLDEYEKKDIIFLDIDLPKLNGMEAAKRLRERDSDVIIIFVTNLAQFAVGGYEVGAFDFIVKPTAYPNFAMKLRRALKYLYMRRGREVWVTTRSGKRLIDAAELKYVEVMKHVITYHLCDDTVIGSGTLKYVIEQLEGLPFALCNRCYLVNMNYVTEINGNTVVVGGDKLLISAPRKKEFLSSFNEFLGAGGGG